MNTVPETVHGGLDFAELRSLDLDASSVLDFSASINPLGAPPGVWDSMRRLLEPELRSSRPSMDRH